MSFRIVWLIAIVIVLGALDVGVAVLDSKGELARSVNPGDKLRDFDPQGVAKVVLTRAGRSPLVLARAQGGAWVVASAKSFPARAGKVDQLLARIRSWKRERTAGEAKNHEQFSVTREKGIGVRIEDFAGAPLADILVGALTGLDPEEARNKGGNVDTSRIGRYMRLADEDPVYVVSDFVTGELEPDPQEWLERPITGGDESKAKALVIRRRNGETLAVALDPPFPRMATADQRPVDGERVKAIVKEVLNAWATDVTEGDEAVLGLQPPLLAAEVLFSDGAPPARLFLGEAAPTSSHTNPSWYARVPEKPGPLLVPQMAVAQVVSATAESVALAHVLGEKQPASIQRATLRDGERTVTLERDQKGAWTVSAVGSGTASAPRPLEDAKRTRAFEAALKLPVAAFDRLGPTHGLASPEAILTLELASKERLEVSIGAQEGPHVWVRRHDIPVAIAVPAEAVLDLRVAFRAAAD